MIYVLPYGVLIKADRADEIAAGPEMVSPIGLLSQFRVALEKLYRNLTFQGSHQLGDGNLGRKRNKQMDVIILDVQLLNATFLPLAQRPDIMLDQFLYGSLQYSEPILWNPDNVIIAFINDMAQSYTYSFHKNRHSHQNMTTCKAGGYSS